MSISQTNQPQLPNLCVTIVNGKYSYLWPYTTKIVNGRMVRTKGPKSVGSIQGGGQTGLVIWKEEFLNEHQELKAFDVYRVEASTGEQETTGEYQFVFVDKSTKNHRKNHIKAGATWFLDQSLATTPLLRALNNTFYKEQAANIILSLSYFVLLSKTLDFNHYINCIGSLRLPYAKGLSERDINLFLKDISDVQIAKFFDELQYRYFERNSLTKQFYVIEHSYPNNLINHMIESNTSLSCSNSNLQQAIKKELQKPHWHTVNIKNKLSAMAKSLDDRAFTIVNSDSGIPLFASTYNSHNFSLAELLNFCRDRVFVKVNKKDFNKNPNHLSQEYLEATTGGFNDIKASNAPDLMSLLGSYSEQGQIFTRLQFDEQYELSSRLDYEEPESLNTLEQGSSINDATSSEDELTKAKAQTVQAPTMLSPLRKKLSGKTPSNSSTSFGSNLAFTAPLSTQNLQAKNIAPQNWQPKKSLEPKLSVLSQDKKGYEVTLISEAKVKLLTQLCTLCQNQQSFILKLASDHHIVKRWSDHFINLLLTPTNYSQDDQSFTLSTVINLSLTDPSSTHIVKGKSGKLFSIPKKVTNPLFLSIKLDLHSLFDQAQQLENSLMDPSETSEAHDSFWNAQQCLSISTLDKHNKIDESLAGKLLAIKESLDSKVELKKSTLVDLYGICQHLLKVKHYAFSIVLSNSVNNANQAYHALDLLNAKEQFSDYMSWDIFKLERVLFEPFMYQMRPEVSQLLRAKFFILFISSSLYNMIQCTTFNKDQLYGTNKIRYELGFNNPHEYLELLNTIIAERQKEGLIYQDINMQQQSLLEYLNTNAPSKEGFSNVSTDSQVSMRNYETKNHWLL